MKNIGSSDTKENFKLIKKIERSWDKSLELVEILKERNILKEIFKKRHLIWTGFWWTIPFSIAFLRSATVLTNYHDSKKSKYNLNYEIMFWYRLWKIAKNMIVAKNWKFSISMQKVWMAKLKMRKMLLVFEFILMKTLYIQNNTNKK